MLHVAALALVVQIWNVADVPEPELERARLEVTRLYAEAGVAIAWSASVADVRVVLVERDTVDLKRPGRTVLGAAIETDQGTRIAYVFYRRVAAEAENHGVPRAMVLACAIAHEVGHLLMRGRSHSPTGLMRACWTHDDFVRAADGQLTFSRFEQARLRSSDGRRAPQ